ncbi:Nsp1-like C-terminal region-domain-containing protein [Mycena rosella]|uniref:Nucleoporin NSP1 n=1 Tax=Mycena rosella TaxID=1033263 RepID=A0AAD7DVF6_MYCRO|nr:Nsp1-like C-terminal region-domain-containing protein [Mycena rosella]
MSFFSNQPASGNAFGATPSGTNPAPNLFGGGAAKPAGSGLFGGGNTAAPASGGLFGNNNAAPAPPASGGLFGGGAADSGAKLQTSLFGGAPAGSSNIFGASSNANATAAPTPNLFGSSQPPAAANSLFGGGGLAKPAEPAAAKPSFFSQPGSSTGPAAAPAVGGFNLPAKPADAPPAAAPTNNLFGKPAGTSTPAPTASPFSIGGNKDGAAAPAPAGGFFAKPTAGPAPTASSAPAPGAGAISLFGSTKPDEKKDAPATSFGLSKPKEGEQAPGLASAPSTGSGPVVAVAPPSMLRGKTIEEIVNKWSSELETHVREFNKFAGEVAVWDRALIENGNNLAALYSHVLAAEREQNDIDQSLDHIEQQQKDLSSTLDAYEKATQEVFGGHGGNLRALDAGPADTERDKNYMLATDLHTQLDDLSGSLTQMIESVNGLSLLSGPEVSGDDPMAQIAQILGSHLESLQWIDGAVREVEGKVTEVETRVNASGYSTSTGTKRGYGL